MIITQQSASYNLWAIVSLLCRMILRSLSPLSRRRLRSAQEGGRSVKALPPPSSYLRVCRCSSSSMGEYKSPRRGPSFSIHRDELLIGSPLILSSQRHHLISLPITSKSFNKFNPIFPKLLLNSNVSGACVTYFSAACKKKTENLVIV